jgi:hypothetical protein
MIAPGILIRLQHPEIPVHERDIMNTSLHKMVECLRDAMTAATDPPDAPFMPTTHLVYTGRPGRPRIGIPPELLALTLDTRGPTEASADFNCSARTVRRRAIENGLAEPGAPVYVEYEQEDGIRFRVYRSSSGSQSDLSDNDLDEVMLYIITTFPSFGRRMIDGHLKYLGHHIPRSRIQASYRRVCGAPTQSFGVRRIQRRVYKVPGPNSLWHHDGQHGKPHVVCHPLCSHDLAIGLIRWKIVIHAFVDGFSRFVTAIRCSGNNLAATVLEIFLEAVRVHGFPSRMRGDHGTENLLVAELMEETKGLSRGSYIWGRYDFNFCVYCSL